MSAQPAPFPALPETTLPEPGVTQLELERLRREVKSRLFGSTEGPVKIGRYTILDCIGSGGMGIVYSARDERLGRTVALKLLKPELTGNRASNLSHEAQSLAKLAHPNVVAVFDVGEHEGQLFVAMEYVEGQNLRRWLQRRPSLGEILRVFQAAGEGLAAAHRAGLVHRDFKPDNVLVGTDGRPRILDFGLARAPDQDRGEPQAFADDTDANATSFSRYGVLLGTPAYMAPEQHLGERADARSDQFGFCVALFQAVFGFLPFPTDDLRTLSLAIVSGRITPPPSDTRVPAALRNLLRRGMSVDPDARFPTMSALLDALEGVRADVDHPLPERGELESAPTTPAPQVIQLDPNPNPNPNPNPLPPSADPGDPALFDTRAIHQVFGVGSIPGAGSPGTEVPSTGLPALTADEMRDIAREVGLDLDAPDTPPTPETPEHHQWKPGFGIAGGPLGDLIPAPPFAHRRKRHTLVHDHGEPDNPGRRLPERREHGLRTQVRSERDLPTLPGPETRHRIIRELEQNLGGAGTVEHFDSGMAWSNREAEVSIDRRPDGARLTLRRSFGRIARKRRRRGMVFGSVLGLIAGAVMTDLIPNWLHVIEPLFVFGGAGIGLIFGHHIAEVLHGRQMNEERAQLDWLGERVEVLVEAEMPALPRGER